jgi:hypothetical protein
MTTQVVARIRRLDAGNRFFHLVISKATEKRLVAELELYLAQQPFNPSYLASGVRHIFAHGMLTPNANRSNPDTVAKICDLLAEAHLSAAADDFQARVGEAVA